MYIRIREEEDSSGLDGIGWGCESPSDLGSTVGGRRKRAGSGAASGVIGVDARGRSSTAGHQRTELSRI